jgi:hypothetical protein
MRVQGLQGFCSVCGCRSSQEQLYRAQPFRVCGSSTMFMHVITMLHVMHSCACRLMR